MLIVMAKDFKTTAEIPVPKRLIDQIIGQEKGVEIIKKAANQKRNVLLIGEPGCLVGDERIVLGNGTIAKIGELGNEHLQKLSIDVRTGEGGWKKAEATVFHYYKNQPIIEIITESGKSIKGTYNHPLRCFKGISREYLWKRLDEISVGDKVAAVTSIPCRTKKLVKTNFKKLNRTYGPNFYGKLPQKVTPELAAVIGYVLGDGWIRDTSVEFLVAEPEKDILPPLVKLCKSLFEIEPKVKGRLPAERNVKMYTVSLYSKDIAHNLCFLREKRVPELIFKSGNAVVASFLKWLFEADGTVLNAGRGKRMVGLRAKDIELLRDVQILLLHFSIHSRITFAGGNGYYLMIRRGNDIIKFARSIGFASKKKTTILRKLAADAKKFARVKGQRFEKIKKIIHHPPQDVFDIEVPKCHRFIANGLISHNTGKSMLAQAMAELLPIEKLQDILILPNIADKNNPKVLVTPAGEGKKILENEKKKSLELESMNELKPSTSMLLFISLLFTLSIVAALYLKLFSDIILAAFIIIGGIFLAILIFASAFTTGLKNMRMGGREEETTPKLLVDNSNKTIAPFIDATGAHSGALLGDIRHDPFQSGGLGTPAHLRVECISPDSLVFLENGDVKKVEDLIKNEFVVNFRKIDDAEIYYLDRVKVLGEKDFKVTASKLYRIIRRKNSEQMLKLRTTSGDELKVLPTHPIAVFKGGEITYELAKNIPSHATIIRPRIIRTLGINPKAPIFERALAHNSAHLQLEEELNEDSCYWLGGMLSDGDFSSMQFCSSSENLCSGMSDSFCKFTGLKPKIYRRNNGYFFTSYGLKEVEELVYSLGLKSKKAHEKAIPEQFMGMPANLSAALLAGLFDGDGCITEEGELSYSSVSKELAFQVRNLLLQHSIQASLKISNNTKWNKRPLFIIRAHGYDPLTKFLEDIPIKRENLKKNLLHFLSKTNKSKTFKRRSVPEINDFIEELRKDLYLNQDEVVPKRGYTNYKEYAPSIEKLKEMLLVFKKRFDELSAFSVIASNGSWTELKKIAKELHLGYRKVGKLSQSGYDFRYEKNLDSFRNFFEKTCKVTAINSDVKIKQLEKICEGDIYFDKIDSVTKSTVPEFVYDLTTETGNFFVENFLVKNCGMIHKANKGVLFIDEISTLSPKSQQELLSAMQDKKYSITGQSEMSSGAMVRTDPVPCDFVLVASGNLFDLEKMHPALRSRIRGYGYEIYLNEFIDDNAMDRKKLERFVAQEVVKDGKIEHFTKEAVDEIIFEAKRRAGTKGKFTLRLRDLGGLVRAAGDIAKTEHAKIVTRDHVIEAKKLARTLEQQVADKQIIQKKEYEVFVTHGYKVGKVNGLAVMGTEKGNFGGILLPIEAQVAPALSAREGKIIATGKLGEIAKEAVQNVSAIIKKYKGTDISSYDTHIQFLQTYEGVEGDSASVSVATAVISALENIPVDLSLAMTGSLSVRGEVLPVGGVSAKIEAAIEAGAKRVIIPAANREDVVLSPEKLKKIKILTANNLCDVLSAALKPGKEKDRLIKGILKIVVC